MSSAKEQTYLQQNKEEKSYFNKFVETWIFSWTHKMVIAILIKPFVVTWKYDTDKAPI